MTVLVHIDASEVHELADDIRRNTDELPGRAQLVTEKVGYDTVAYCQATVAVDTGFLKGSIGVDFEELGFTAGPTADYGDVIERGVPHPFVIRAKTGGTLHFVIDGHDVFAASVTHPPISPRPYMGPAFDRGLPQFESALAQLGEQVLSRG
jgi:hypothetical protein